MAEKETVVLEIDASSLAKEIGDATLKLEAYKRELEQAVEEGGKFSEGAAIASARVSAQRKEVQQLEGSLTRITQAEKSLGSELVKNIKNYDAGKNSIDQNRKVLNALTAEYVRTKNPTKEFSDRIKSISDTLKQQEAAIGDTRRNVGNYAESLREAAQGLPVFGKAMQGVNAIASANPIGLVVESLSALFGIISQNEAVMEFLEQSFAAIGAITNTLGNELVNFGRGVFESAKGIRSFGDAMNLAKEKTAGFFEQFINNLKTNPVETLLDSVLAVISPLTVLQKKLFAVSDAAVRMAKQQATATKALQDLEDAERKFSVVRSENETQIYRLIKASKDRTKTDEERIALLNQANSLLKTNGEVELKLADAKVKAADLAMNANKGVESFEVAAAQARVERANRQRENLVLLERITNDLNSLEADIAKEKEDRDSKTAANEAARLAERAKKFEAYSKQIQEAARMQRTFEQEVAEQKKETEDKTTDAVLEATKKQIAAEKAKEKAMKDSVKAAEDASREKIAIQQAELSFAESVSVSLIGLMQNVADASGASAAFQKAISLFTILVQQGLAIANGIATAMAVPFPGNLAAIASVIAAVTTVIGTAISSVSSAGEAPVREFAEGGAIPIEGKSHAEGGENVYIGNKRVANVEGGEGLFVMKKSAYAEINKLGSWNMLYGGNSWNGSAVKHAAQGGMIADGGFTARATMEQALNRELMRDVITQLVDKMPAPVVSVEEINRVGNSRKRAVKVAGL